MRRYDVQDMSKGASKFQHWVWAVAWLPFQQVMEPPSEVWLKRLQPDLAPREVRQSVRDFRLFRDGKQTPEKIAEMIVSCLDPTKQDPFCPYLGKDWKSHIVPTFDSTEDIVESEPESVLSEEDRNFLKGVSRMQYWDRFEQAATDVLESATCPSVPLVLRLGLKAEEFFPSDKSREMAEALYSTADRCGAIEDTSAETARFRLSLLHLWKNDCQKADPVLERIVAWSSGRFQTRALFWSAQCAEARGDTIAYEQIKVRLLKNNPFGIHSIGIQKEGIHPWVHFARTKSDPEVMVRSALRPELNRDVVAIELLLAEEEVSLAREIFQEFKTRIAGSESAFRLYASILADKMGDPIGVFQILAGTLREDPGLVSSGTLRLIYPMHQWRLVQKNADAMDPIWALALIRQESGFRTDARSRVGALGLMQIMPQTGRAFAGVSRRALLNPSINVQVGTRYFRHLKKRFNGNTLLALAGYNAGPEAVGRWVTRYTVDDPALFLEMIPFYETRNYVALIARNHFWYSQLYQPQTPSSTASAWRGLASENGNKKE